MKSKIDELHEMNDNMAPQKNTELIERKAIEGTPFVIIKKEEKYFLTFGKYQISDALDSEHEIMEYLLDNSWNIITNIAGIIADHTVNNKK